MVRNLWFGPCRGLGLIPGLGTKTQESASHSARAPNPPPHKSNLTGAWDEVRKLRRQVCPQTSGVGDLAWSDRQRGTEDRGHSGTAEASLGRPRGDGECWKVPRSNPDPHQRVCAAERTRRTSEPGASGVCGGQAGTGRAPSPGDAGRNRPSFPDNKPCGTLSVSVSEHLPSV